MLFLVLFAFTYWWVPCVLSLSSPSAFRRTGKQEELAGDVAVDHIWTRSQVTAPVSRTSRTSQSVCAMHVNLEVY